MEMTGHQSESHLSGCTSGGPFSYKKYVWVNNPYDNMKGTLEDTRNTATFAVHCVEGYKTTTKY